MTKKIRVRFAPSPTGPLHIGGVRTALFNYLFAKKNGGDFILRIEDTDQKRYVEGAEDYIVNSLDWCGIPFDEGPGKDGGYGPYRQSERKHLYKQYVDQLIEKGFAYYAFDTPEELDAHRKDHEAKGKTFIYNWHNRLKLKNSLSLSESEVTSKIEAREAYSIRFKCPENEQLVFHDLIRGQITIDTNILDDKVLFKSDGMPTYHLANIVDDHLMEISHVIRGEEWLPSLALHVLLYKALQWEAPQFAHLPLILKPTGNGKLSKRDGDKFGFPVFPLEWKDPKTNDVSRGYREDGYFQEAVINFLAFLGWNPGTDQETFSLNELIQSFEIERVNKSGARFDPEKIKWYNHHYLQQKTDAELANSFSQILKSKGTDVSMDRLTKIISLLKERATFISDFLTLSDYFFHSPTSYDEKASKKQWKEDTSTLMEELISVINNIEDYSSQSIESVVKQWITDKELGFGKIMAPLRLSLVGSLKGAHIFDIMALIGKEETVSRISKAIDTL
ncbi:glutamate--tRNA ligase [Flavobacteriaceae bacterium R38]|nr:glutamate--tRNA ligase [Flavobacteriaceae bacterium R38]